MNRFQVVITVDVPDELGRDDVLLWAAAMLDTAFTKPNPAPHPPPGYRDPMGPWKARVPMPPSEHPYRPVLTEVRRVR